MRQDKALRPVKKMRTATFVCLALLALVGVGSLFVHTTKAPSLDSFMAAQATANHNFKDGAQ